MSESVLPFTYDAVDEQETDALGQQLARLLPASSVVGLVGPLGAGKTRLVQAVCAAAGVDRRLVSSPTYVLVHEYQGSRPIFHFDVYRLQDDDEFLALAPHEYFEAGGISFVEWADRVAACLPADYVEIFIEPTGERSRRFRVTSRGKSLDSVIQGLHRWQPPAGG